MQKHAPNPYGTYRVISPKGVLPQPADVIDNNMEIWDNEVLIDVQTLNIDSASFTEIVKRVLNKKPAEVTTKEEMEAIGNKMKEIVAHAGKHKNPWTGSGGMLMGTVEQVGDNYVGDLKPGDKIATLVSLSLTPLRIDEILEMRPAIEICPQVPHCPLWTLQALPLRLQDWSSPVRRSWSSAAAASPVCSACTKQRREPASPVS